MSHSELLAVERRGLISCWRGAAGPAGIIELPGAFGTLTPNCPERSVANSVVYEDPGSLAAALREIAPVYAEHGCAWTVWIWPGDDDAARVAERAGLAYDGSPQAMAMELTDLDAAPDPGLEWSVTEDWAALGALNDAAYDYGDDSMSRAVGAIPGVPVWLAHEDGEPVAGLSLYESEGHAHVIWVATHPRAAGNRYAGRLLRQALLQARDRGARTSALEATKRGEPAYAGIGFRPLGSMGMWEFRP